MSGEGKASGNGASLDPKTMARGHFRCDKELATKFHAFQLQLPFCGCAVIFISINQCVDVFRIVHDLPRIAPVGLFRADQKRVSAAENAHENHAHTRVALSGRSLWHVLLTMLGSPCRPNTHSELCRSCLQA